MSPFTNQSGKRHKVFVSYHHENDQRYRDRFEELFSSYYDILVSKSVEMGDIDPNLSVASTRQKIRDEFLRDSTVTVVLVGLKTWQRKHVDWEIGSSIRDTEYNPRSGLLGIILPSYRHQNQHPYNKYTIPPRLSDNIDCEYATMHHWSENPRVVQRWIHEAFNRRKTITPDNSYPSFTNNRSGDRW